MTPDAAVELAEREPLLGHRLEPVRAAIAAAAPLLDAPDTEPTLRARLMLRLASLKMVELDFEGAEQALASAGRHAPDARALRFLGGARACRVALRRGDRISARDTLIATAAQLPELDAANDPQWRAVTIETALGVAEVALSDDAPEASAFAPLAELVRELERQPRYTDAVFSAHQLLAAGAMFAGEPSAPHLRAAVTIAREVGSPADEVEARIALASALVAQGDAISLEEATRTIQIAHDRALEHDLGPLRRAALLAQAGVMSNAGKTAGAVDRVIELARTAAAESDVPGYVAAAGVMAELYARTGDHVSAFRALAEANHALSAALGRDTAELFRPYLARLRDAIGPTRLTQIAADVDRANRLAAEIAT